MPDTSGGRTGGPDFHEEMDRFEGHMPDWAGRNLKRLRHPRAAWLRVPAGVALTGGGVLSVLPGLGLWMVPVGLALLAHDVPPMRQPLARVLRFTNVKIEELRERRRNVELKRATGKPIVLAPKLAAKAGVHAAPDTVVRAAAKTAPRSAVKATTKISTKPVAKTATRSRTNAATKAAENTTTKSVTKSASGKATKTARKTASENASKSRSRRASKA